MKNNFLIHEELYQTNVLGEKWVRAIPANLYDAIYFRCPEDQFIISIPIKFGGGWESYNMSDEDYIKRIYKNLFFKWSKGLLYNNGDSYLYAPDFNKLVEGPIHEKGNDSFKIVWESIPTQAICGNKKEEYRILDVFFRDRKSYFSCGNCTRFILLRYRSKKEYFDKGLNEFNNLVNSFKRL